MLFILVFFGFPIIYGVDPPDTFSPRDLGFFLGSILKYWLDVLKHVLEKLGFDYLAFVGYVKSFLGV